MKSEQEKYKMQVSTEQKNDNKKLIEITNEKRNLEEQVITLKPKYTFRETNNK